MDRIVKRVQPGSIWQVGRHRLACIDSTNEKDIRQLFEGQTWDVLISSPPYLAQRTYGRPAFNWTQLLTGVTHAALAVASERFHMLINLGLVHRDNQVVEYWGEWLSNCKQLELPLCGWYVWDKLHGMPGRSYGRLAPAHEFIFHFYRKPWPPNKWVDKKPENITERLRTTFRQKDGSVRPASSPKASLARTKIADSVIRLNSEKTRGLHSLHPAAYPVALPTSLLKSFALQGQIVFDPFAGSGTTMLAADNLGLPCYCSEVKPDFCDIILARLESLKGVKCLQIA